MARAAVSLSLAIVVGQVGGTGCATASPRAGGLSSVDPERTVVELRAKNTGYARRIDELENRIFLLEDELDSRELAAEQRAPAVLPTRSLRSERLEDTASAHGGATNGLARVVETSIVAEHPVEFTGEAIQPLGGDANAPGAVGDGRRPHLQLSAKVRDVRRAGMLSHAPEPGLDDASQDAAWRARSSVEPLRRYREALETLRAGHPEPALTEFRRFLDENPRHDYSDNAQYWIGECYYDQRQFPAAVRAFRAVVEDYPRGNKVPDAMLKLGFTMQALGDEAGGRAVLESLARAFPKHEAARLASARLADPLSPVEPAGDKHRGATTSPDATTARGRRPVGRVTRAVEERRP